MKRFLIFVMTVALFVGGLYLWNTQRRLAPSPGKFTPAETVKTNPAGSRGLLARDEEFTRLVESAVPSVVSITTSRKIPPQSPALIDPFEQFFGRRPGTQPREQIQNSLGSGVIVSKEGHILTNNHVIANKDEIKVQLNDGRAFPAKIIGSDERSDIALLKIDAPGLQPLPLGDSDRVKVGQVVFAVGNPFGLEESVSLGIISAKGRRAADDSTNEFFQTDAAINPGNSGGPLINVRGEIIGITSYTGSEGSQGIGFAIPANTAKTAMESLIKTGRVVRGYLGVVIQQLTPEIAARLGMRETEGALVTDVTPGSPAEKAGLKSGDLIRKFNGRDIRDIRELRTRVAEIGIGAKAELLVIRGEKEITITAGIAEQPDGYGTRAPSPTPQPSPGIPQTQNPLSGIQVAEIPADHLPQFPENVKGVIVVSVEPGSFAAQFLQPGDAIEEINRQPSGSVQDFQKIAGTLKPGEKVMLFICRGKMRSFVVVGS